MCSQVFFMRLAQFTFVLSVVVQSTSNTYQIKSHIQNEWLVNDVICKTNEVLSKSIEKRSFSHDFDPFRNDVSVQDYFPLQEVYPQNNSVQRGQDFLKPNKHYDLGIDKISEKNYDLGIDKIIKQNYAGIILDSDEEISEPFKTLDENFPNSTINFNLSSPTLLLAGGVAKKEHTRINVNCDYLEIGENVINASVSHLDLNSNGLLSITSEWAANATNLSSIKILSSNGLVTPSNRSWLPTSVRSLTLSHSHMKEAYFGGCQSDLQKLYVSGTNLHKLTICFHSLEELDASWNSLSDGGVTFGGAGGGRSVRDLKLSHNHLSFWTSCGWPSLVHLDLQINKLHRIDIVTCPPLNLFSLNLKNNRLEEPPAKYPPKLSIIDLSHNHIKKTTPFHRGVEEIDLSHNFLAFLERGTFRSAKQLLTLDLSHNHLTVLYGHDFTGLRELRVLDVSHNVLNHIRHETFYHLRFLQSLILHDNNLNQLDARLLAHLPPSVNFRAQNNPWHCSCHLLAAISKASKGHCKPHCKEPNIKCREGKEEFWAIDVLKKCIEAVEDRDNIHLTLEPNSVEDTSEEINDSHNIKSPSSNYSYAAISGAVLLLAIPFIAVAIRKLYLNRKKIKRCLNCLEPSNDVLSPDNMNRLNSKVVRSDSDSETEF